KLPDMLHAAFVRSLYAHGHLRGIDAETAKAAPGVRLVLTGADLEGETDPFPLFGRDADLVRVLHPVLARDRVRYVGEPVALVVADTAEQAADAAEWVMLEVEELSALVDPREAEASPPLHDEAPDNVLLRLRLGSGDVDAAFASAHAIVRQTVRIPRLIAAPLEPRAVLASHDPESDVLTLWLSAQDQHRQLAGLSQVLRRPPERLRVVVPDVGGAFGSKGVPQAESAALAFSAIRLGRAVKWTETRTENSLAVYQGRGAEVDAELALAADGRMLGLRARVLADLGAYLYTSTPVSSQTLASLLVGCYAIPAADVEVTGVCTTKVPTGPYRGAGRPEAALAIERLVDRAAADLALDRVEIRRRNVIPGDAFPYRSPLGHTYDSGDYAGALDAALELSRWDDLLAQRDRLRAAGRLAGAGLALYVERAGPGWESAHLRLEEDGSVVLHTGSSSHGQGHETTFAQIVAEELSVEPDAVAVRWGDSFEIPEGVGTFASRSVTVGGSAALLAARELKARLDAGETAPLEASTRFELPGPVFSFGAYVATVEVEPETGETHLQTLVAVDDCGRVINPLLADGQIQGGVVQAIGECFHEQVGYDDDGQPLAVNLYEYHLPTAQSLPELATALRETPSPFNPLGAKGVGEGGSIGTPAAVANAVADALAPLGIRHLDPPYTASRVWEAMRTASLSGSPTAD
ncbi:MAG TPA: xanthine dehydrogenase family protein molybdopterin-binding subunit, partial [Gaiellaceae bacterium]|nr:xanthine dehydrogenase family protein molybdopterin-binding subunit [Gaiellaceae bacterium]